MVVTEYEVGPGAYGVAIAADGTVWTSLVERGELACVGRSGQVSRVRLGSADSRPMVLALDPDAAVWFSRGDGRIGRVEPGGAVSALWAGLIALADQNAHHSLGFVNPAIYRIARSPSYHEALSTTSLPVTT